MPARTLTNQSEDSYVSFPCTATTLYCHPMPLHWSSSSLNKITVSLPVITRALRGSDLITIFLVYELTQTFLLRSPRIKCPFFCFSSLRILLLNFFLFRVHPGVFSISQFQFCSYEDVMCTKLHSLSSRDGGVVTCQIPLQFPAFMRRSLAGFHVSMKCISADQWFMTSFNDQNCEICWSEGADGDAHGVFKTYDWILFSF